MSTHVFQIENGQFGLSTTDPGGTVDSVDIGDFSDFTCQITSGALNATPNVSTIDVPASWCQPASSTPNVGVTTYDVGLTILQDPDVVAGLSRFLYEHDTEVAWFLMGMGAAAGDPPKAYGKLRVVAGTIGGEARTTLTATLTLPCDGKPQVMFGDASGSAVVPSTTATGATAGTPGLWTPSGSTPPASVAALIAGTPNPVAASPSSAWTTGQYVQTATAGTTGQAHWSGSAWVSGVA